jgi:glycosyltransferase involved in cell wall biosynthesis
MIIGSLDDPRVVKLRHTLNQGLPAALNTGFAATTGAYLTWTSDDNLYTSDALETMASHLDAHPLCHFVYADYWEFDEDGIVGVRKHLCSPSQLMETNCVGACFMYRREVYQTIGNYDLDARLVEDWEYWLRVSRGYCMEHLPLALYYYRSHPRSLTSQSGVRHLRWRKITRLRRQRFGWSWRRYWREMAEIDIDEAFACYQEMKYHRVAPLALRGIGRNPAWLANLGVVSIVLRSLRHSRKGSPAP